MTDPVYTDEQLDDTRKFFRDAAQGKHGSFIPVKDRAGQVADMLDDLAEKRAEAKFADNLFAAIAGLQRASVSPPLDYTGDV